MYIFVKHKMKRMILFNVLQTENTIRVITSVWRFNSKYGLAEIFIFIEQFYFFKIDLTKLINSLPIDFCQNEACSSLLISETYFPLSGST